jgi:hypothetical protein
VAKAIGDLVNGKETESASNLLNVSTLLNAILYTQGRTGAEGDYRLLDVFASNCTSTRTPARLLKPLVQALTTSGGGRFEVIKSACERGAFNDLRLIDPSIAALGDSFPELADLVSEKILPGYGPGIAPRLKSSLDLKGKRHDARKLQVLHRLDPAGTLDLCKTALEDGSPEVKTAAIGCLGEHEDCIPLLLEQAGSKNKTLRAAALNALAVHDRPDITKLFTDLISGKALDILAQPFRTLKNQLVLNALLVEGKRTFGAAVKGDSEQIPRLWEILDCLDHRKEAEVEDFVLACFVDPAKLSKLKPAKNSAFSGADLTARLASLLCNIGSAKSLEAVLAKRSAVPSVAFPQILQSALRIWPADRMFAEFSPLLGQGKGAGKEQNEMLQGFISALHWDPASSFDPMSYSDLESDERQMLRKVEWDPRWLDAAIKADAQTVVSALARPGHKSAVKYLLSVGEAKKTSEAGSVVQALARCEYPKVTDYFLELVRKKLKGAKHIDYELRFLFEQARHLPVTDLPKLDEFAAGLDEKFVDDFLEALGPLRAVTNAEQAG